MKDKVIRRFKNGNEYELEEVLDAVKKHGFAKTTLTYKDGEVDRAVIEISVKVKRNDK